MADSQCSECPHTESQHFISSTLWYCMVEGCTCPASTPCFMPLSPPAESAGVEPKWPRVKVVYDPASGVRVEDVPAAAPVAVAIKQLAAAQQELERSERRTAEQKAFLATSEQERVEAEAKLRALDAFLPTAEQKNALPAGLRRYVHDLETQSDPAGMVADNICQRENARALSAGLVEESARSTKLAQEREALREAAVALLDVLPAPRFELHAVVAQAVARLRSLTEPKAAE